MTGYIKPLIYFLTVSYLFTISLWAQEPENTYPDYMPPTIEKFSDMVRRPLFTQKRRPANIPDTQLFDPRQNNNAQRPTKTNFLLSGIVFNGVGYVALIKETNAGETLSLSKGKTIGGWVVTDIKPEEVWLKSGTRSAVLSLRDNKMSDAEKQKIIRMNRNAKKLERRKIQAQKKLYIIKKIPLREQLRGQARERRE